MKKVKIAKRIKTSVAFLVAIILLAITCLYFAKLRPKLTLDDVEILSETKEYVSIRHRSGEGRLYKEFAWPFDGDFDSWFGEGRWTTMSLLSPSATSVEAYHLLRTEIFAGESDFQDNRIDSDNGVAKFVAVAPGEDMVTSKAMLEHNQLWFVRGDQLWFTGRYYIESGMPFTIVDFQERGRHLSPGPRITISEQKQIGVELKHGLKPKLRQDIVKVPFKQWFNLKVHLSLDHPEGHARVWQDDVLIIDQALRTLPAKNSILNALEVGITATSEPTVLWVDRVQISHEPL